MILRTPIYSGSVISISLSFLYTKQYTRACHGVNIRGSEKLTQRLQTNGHFFSKKKELLISCSFREVAVAAAGGWVGTEGRELINHEAFRIASSCRAAIACAALHCIGRPASLAAVAASASAAATAVGIVVVHPHVSFVPHTQHKDGVGVGCQGVCSKKRIKKNLSQWAVQLSAILFYCGEKIHLGLLGGHGWLRSGYHRGRSEYEGKN